MRYAPIIIAVCFAAVLSGCALKSVLVIDAMKRPIRESKVEPITQSMNLPILMTDETGIVMLPYSPQKIEWVSVTKDGFTHSGQIPVDTSGHTVVILQQSK